MLLVGALGSLECHSSKPLQAKKAKEDLPDTRALVGVVWGPGERYLFELRSEVALDVGTGQESLSYEMMARAEISVVERRSDRTTLYLRMPDAAIRSRLRSGKSNFDELGRELREGDCMLVLAGGRLVEFGFRKGASNAAVTSYRQIAASLQVSTSPMGKEEYSEEYDTTGQYLAAYTFDRSSSSYSKKKVRYESLLGHPLGPNGAPLRIVPEVLRSEGRIQLSADGRLDSLELKDDVVLKGAQVPLRSSTRIELKRTSIEQARPSAELRSLVEGFTVVAASEPDAAKRGVEALDRARTGGASFREIAARVEADQKMRPAKAGVQAGKSKVGKPRRAEQVETAADPRLFDALAASLRSEEGAVAEAVAMVKSKPAMSTILIDALGAASCSECQAALIAMVDSDDRDVGRRALYALVRTPRPGDRAVATMKAILEKKPYDANALLALGSYSRRFRDDGKREQAAELGEILVRRLASAAGSIHVLTALRAVENSGYAGAVGTVSRFIDDGNDAVRTAAIMALGPIRDPAVDEILAARLRPDSLTATKLSVIEAARVREPSSRLISAIARSYEASSANVRQRAVDLLAQWLPRQPSQRVLLEKISRSDPEERIRARAKGAL